MMSENIEEKATLVSALEWHILHGADEMLLDEPQDRTKLPEIQKMVQQEANAPDPMKPMNAVLPEKFMANKVLSFQDSSAQEDMMGAAQAIEEAQKIASECESLEALQAAIEDFSGLSVKKTASNIVFADGNPKSDIMVIGEAPGADEDIQGKPYVGEGGQLLDKILACIDLDRGSEEAEKSVYLSNVLNWRPPGNRTPSASEMNISRPFIERHIALVQPKILLICGGVAAKVLLRSDETISKMRGKFHDYAMMGAQSIPAMVTYHPDYLLRTPAQKKAVWADMLMFREKLKNL